MRTVRLTVGLELIGGAMYKYTVVLLRPEYLSEDTGEEYGQDIYVATVEAESMTRAIAVAQAEVMAADKKDKLKPKKATDYKLCVMFDGHPTTAAFGWQT